MSATDAGPVGRGSWVEHAESALAQAGRRRGGARRAMLELLDRQSCALTALQIEAARPYSLYGRGVAKRKRGDVPGGNADMARAKAKVPGIAEEFAKYGVPGF